MNKLTKDLAAAIVHDREKLPEPGDVIKSIKIDEYNIADITFESGKSVAVHLVNKEKKSK